MHVRYTDYLLSGFKGDCRISVIVDGWKEAEKLFQAENNNSQQNAIETSNNIVNEISKLLGGGEDSRKNMKPNCDGEIQNEILNVKEEKSTNLFLFSDDDEEKLKQQTEINNLMKDIDSLTDKNGKNTETHSKSPNLNLNYNYETGKATLKPGTSDLDENGQKILSLASEKLHNNNNNSNSTENNTFSDLFNKPSLLYVNSDSYTNRFGNTDFAQGITDLTQTQAGTTTINNLSHSTQNNNSSSSPKLHIPHLTQKIDGKLHCHWEGCSFSTPRRTALKRHIQCIHMDVRNYECPFDGCGKRFKRADHLKGHKRICRFGNGDEEVDIFNQFKII